MLSTNFPCAINYEEGTLWSVHYKTGRNFNIMAIMQGFFSDVICGIVIVEAACPSISFHIQFMGFLKCYSHVLCGGSAKNLRFGV